MFIRLYHLNFLPSHIQEAERVYEEDIIPSMKKLKGLADIKFLEPVDKADSFIVLTEWDHQSDAIVYETGSLVEEHYKKIKDFLAKEPTLKTFTFDPVSKATPAWIGGDIEE